jgi:hypothetical protein
MRIVQVLAFVVFSALLFAGGAWALAWWGTPRPPDPIEAGLEAGPEVKSPGVLETAPERRPTGEIQAAPAPKSVSATIHLNSDPQGADATTSLGSRCRTPCSIELSVDGPFTVTFTHRGFAPSIIPVEIEPAQRGASVKFSPDPVFAALEPANKAKIKPARAAASRVAPPGGAQEETSSDGLVSRGWKYLEQKAQDWQMQFGRLIHSAGSR